MNLIIILIFWISTALIVYTYAVYPVLLFLLDRLKRIPDPIFSSQLPPVSIVISAYNEEKVVGARIENCLALDYPMEKLEIIVASDGAEDRTDEIVRGFESRGVKLVSFKERRGKVNVLNEVVPQAQHGIVVFSDANTNFQPDALKTLVRHFQDETVGCAVGLLQFVNAEGSRTGELEGVYWKFETFLKKLEGRRGALLGANGAIYAVRKDLFVSCPPDTIVEDLVLPMKILEKGFKVVYEPQAVAVEETAKHVIQEKERRIRIGAGDFQALGLLRSMLNPLRGFPALAFWSHKVIRWFVPAFMIAAFFSNAALTHDLFYRLMFIAQCLFYAAGFAGQVLNWSGIQMKPFSICYYFVSMNLALFLGFVRFVTGRQRVTWQRTER